MSTSAITKQLWTIVNWNQASRTTKVTQVPGNWPSRNSLINEMNSVDLNMTHSSESLTQIVGGRCGQLQPAARLSRVIQQPRTWGSALMLINSSSSSFFFTSFNHLSPALTFLFIDRKVTWPLPPPQRETLRFFKREDSLMAFNICSLANDFNKTKNGR